MNITFLIGNGFDRNLGLDTTYSDFVKVYKKTEGTTEALKSFRAYIDENEELWSSAELEIGKYTAQFEDGEGELFSECHDDFCEHLAEYLKEQEARINFDDFKDEIKNAFGRLNNFIQWFHTEERVILNEIYNKHLSERRNFNFICYNYTATLDKCLKIVKQDTLLLGSHRVGNQSYSHSVGEVCHVHGTVDKEMVFGVNDESQIVKPSIFDGEYGDIFKNGLIKKDANKSYLENTDAKAHKILQESHLIYIYGMSVGETDKLWWKRVCDWLKSNSNNHLIIQKYEMPAEGVTRKKFLMAERKYKREFINYGQLEEAKKQQIESQIHITDENIFFDVKDIAKSIFERVDCE